MKNNKAYIKIKEHYGNMVAKRSQVPLINHIDEGLEILNKLEADIHTKEAYCLHPLFQNDEDLRSNMYEDLSGISTASIILAMEYRWIANSYLSTGKPEDLVPFTSTSIQQMLYADKVQNEKDFAIHHEGKHPRSKELREYFDNWFKILNIEKT